MACSGKAGTADKVKQAAFALGEVVAMVDTCPAEGPGRDWALAHAHKVAAALDGVLAPVLEEQARLAGEVALLQSAERDGSAALAREDIAADGVKVGDTFRFVNGLDGHRGEVGEVVWIIGGCARLQGKGWRWSGPFSILIDPAFFERVRAVEAPPLASEPGAEGERLATDAELALPVVRPMPAVQGADCDCRGTCGCHYGEDAKTREADCREDFRSGCAAADDLDGPAGDELPFAEQREDRRAQAHAASVREADRKTIEAWKETTLDLATKHGETLVELVNAQTALADMTAQRDAWEASCTSAARELREAGTEIAALVAAWKATKEGPTMEAIAGVNTLGETIERLSARAVSW
jgi:hypothetical protein